MSQTEPPWFYAFCVIVFGGALIAFYRLKCPRCRTALGTVTFRIISYGKSFSRRIDYCPYCGVSLDQPLETPK